jgi:hypothetical protein
MEQAMNLAEEIEENAHLYCLLGDRGITMDAVVV